MRRRVIMLTIFLASLLLVACIPERVVWSPDGNRAAVLGNGGLYLCDGDGNLSDLLAENVYIAAWFADSTRLALVRRDETDSWEQLEALLPEPWRQELIEIADGILGRIQTHADWEQQVNQLLGSGRVNSNEIDVIKRFVVDRRSDKLPQDMRQGWGDDRPWVAVVQIVKVVDRRLEPGLVLGAFTRRVWDLRVSPTGRAVAFTVGDPFDHIGGTPVALHVAPTESAASARQIDEGVSLYPDWSPDGKSLVYAKLDNVLPKQDGPSIGAIIRRQVCADDGRLLDDLKGAAELAGVCMNTLTRIRCLADGRIVFSTIELHLPAVSADMPQSLQLFALDPDRQATLTRLIPRSVERQIEESLYLFEVSPDGKQVAIPGEQEHVWIFRIDTGQFTQVQKTEGKDQCNRTFPSWRGPDELCFVWPIPDAEEGARKAEIVLYSDGNSRVISADWPDEVVKGFLD